MKRDNANGVWWALGAAGLAAAAGMARQGARGSRAAQGPQGGPTQGPQGRPPQGRALRRGRVGGDVGMLWKLNSENLYGKYHKLEFVATREALQNARDAIGDAIKMGKIRPGEGRFDVRWDPTARTLEWEDNGTGMTSDVVFDTFLVLGRSKGKGAQQSDKAGGFGLAKAVLLGCSETFRWKLHSLGSIYLSQGLDEDIVEYPAPFFKQGVTLTVYDVKKQGGWSSNISLEGLLASSETDIHITYNGEPVPYAFHGKGTQVAENLNWGQGVKGITKAYKRLDNAGGIFVRLKGLTQFIESPKLTSDVVIDIETTLRPTDPKYPFNPSRMGLDGRAAEGLYELRQELTVDKASALLKMAEVVLDDDAPREKVEKNKQIYENLIEALAQDEEIQAALRAADVSGAMLGQAFRQQRQQRPASSEAKAESSIKAFEKMAEEASQAAAPATPQKRQALKQQIQKQAQQKGAAQAQRKEDVNPLAGVGKVRLNREQWDKARLAPFLKDPKAMIPLLTLWRLVVGSLLKRKQYGQHFEVGLIFDDNLLAAHQSPSTFYINPARVIKVIEKSPNRPDVVAALLFNNAAHESTHHIGYTFHDESFVAARQGLADYNVDLLPSLTLLTAKLLGMKQGFKTVMPKPKVPRAPKAQKLLLHYSELETENRLKLKQQIFAALEPRQAIDGFLLDEYDWTAASDRTTGLDIYDRPTRDPMSGERLGDVYIGWSTLEFSPDEGLGPSNSKRWTGWSDSDAMTKEPDGTPVDLAKPSAAFLLAEIKKAKKALTKRK